MSVRVIFDEDARGDLKRMDRNERAMFVNHAEKLAGIGPRRHLRRGLDAYVDNVDKDGRMPYKWDDDGVTLRILRCFTDHKEYDRWYKSYKK